MKEVSGVTEFVVSTAYCMFLQRFYLSTDVRTAIGSQVLVFIANLFM